MFGYWRLVIRTEGKEFRVELLTLADVHGLDGVSQPHFLKRDADLAPIGRIPGPESDAHGLAILGSAGAP